MARAGPGLSRFSGQLMTDFSQHGNPNVPLKKKKASPNTFTPIMLFSITSFGVTLVSTNMNVLSKQN